MGARDADERLLFVGGYTKAMPGAAGRGEGITACRFTPADGRLQPLYVHRGLANPAWLAVDAGRQLLYALNVNAGRPGNNSEICALRYHPRSGELRLLNCQSTRGRGACYVWTTDEYALAANYGSGSIAALPLLEDGRLGEASSVIQHGPGSRVNPTRQEGPHAHCILADRSGRNLFVADLGCDKVLVYRLEAGRLVLRGETTSAPGDGPRHIAFHPNGRHVFVVNELSCSVSSFALDTTSGTLDFLGKVSTLPADWHGFNTCAAIHVHPNGRSVYASNRGHDSIAVLTFDERTGGLELRSHCSSGGRTPRDFTLDGEGRWLLVANQDTASIVTLAIDQETGALEPAGPRLEIPAAVCLRWA